jgi:hypothetical protein
MDVDPIYISKNGVVNTETCEVKRQSAPMRTARSSSWTSSKYPGSWIGSETLDWTCAEISSPTLFAGADWSIGWVRGSEDMADIWEQNQTTEVIVTLRYHLSAVKCAFSRFKASRGRWLS